MALVLVILIVALGLALLAYFLIESSRDRTRERLFAGMYDDEDRDVSLWRDAADLLQIEALQNLLGQSPIARVLDRRMRLATIKLPLVPFVVLITMGAIALSAAAYLLFPYAWVGIAVFMVSLLLAWWILSVVVAWRVRKLEMQLPAFVTQLLTTLASGGTPMAALRNAAANSSQPLGGAIADLVRSMELGVAPVTAWRNWADHWGSPGCKLLSTGMRIKWEAGGEMSQMLTFVLDLLEGRRRMDLRVQTLTSQAKFSSIILLSLPFVIGLVTYFFNPDLFDEMLQDELGRNIVIGAGVLMIFGFFWMRRIARLES